MSLCMDLSTPVLYQLREPKVVLTPMTGRNSAREFKYTRCTTETDHRLHQPRKVTYLIILLSINIIYTSMFSVMAEKHGFGSEA